VICRILLVLLLATGSAQAADPDPSLAKIEALEKEARAACDGGRLDEGVRILAELFAKTDDGNYIFNQGRCYQQNGRPQEAVMRLEVYIKRPDADPTASARAKEIIAELRPPPPPVDVDLPPPAAAPGPADPGRTLRRAGLVVAAAGLAALGTATYFGLQIAPIKEDANREAQAIAGMMPASPAAIQRLNDLNARGDRAELLQWISIGVGATALTTGAVLTYLGLQTDADAHLGVRVQPLLAGASLGLAF
jgi:hypothetical protein